MRRQVRTTMQRLVAITPNLTEELCVVMVRLENNKDNITLYLKNGTADFKYTETYRFTDAPDVVNITLDHNTSKTYEYQMLYADYGACFVANFDTESVGCRLWMFENATSTQITACKEGHAQACQGTVDDTWDEESCISILDGA
ncbi:uncharacterized protein LOC144145119 isoform X2 [Haemaphysalis longicornis]